MRGVDFRLGSPGVRCKDKKQWPQGTLDYKLTLSMGVAVDNLKGFNFVITPCFTSYSL